MPNLHSSFSRNLKFKLNNPHVSKKAVLCFNSGAYSLTDISGLIVALTRIHADYFAEYGLNK